MCGVTATAPNRWALEWKLQEACQHGSLRPVEALGFTNENDQVRSAGQRAHVKQAGLSDSNIGVSSPDIRDVHHVIIDELLVYIRD